MIVVDNVRKVFDEKVAIAQLSLNIKEGGVYGLIGSNGSGKSTLLRVIAGIYQPDAGQVLISGNPTFENVELKNELFLVSDEPYFFNQYSLNDTAAFYRRYYSRWSDETYERLCSVFPLNRKARITTFSKGMKRQAAVIIALAASPKYLLLDEAFDGLDPVMRKLLKQIIAERIVDSEMTTVITSHNLRELEELCTQVGLLHMGRLVLEKDLDELENSIQKVQAAFETPPTVESLAPLNPISVDITGRMATILLNGDRATAEDAVAKLNPVFCEILPLTLEEVFLNEMEGIGYDFSQILN